MKKRLSILLVTILCLSLIACGSNTAPAPAPKSEKPYIPHETVTYKGFNSQTIELDSFDEDFWVLHVVGNRNESYFGIWGYDENNRETKLFVNTTDFYDGTTVDMAQATKTLKVESSDNWTIEQISIGNLHSIKKGDQIDGRGDAVYFVYSYGDTVTISGNDEKSYFGVIAYGADKDDLWVNTTDQCKKTVKITNDVYLLSILSEGKWRIKLN